MSQTTPPSAPETEQPTPPTRPPLRRSRTDRKAAGVAGGLAAYFQIDPLIVRIAFVVLTLCGGGVGILLYVAALLLIPDEAVATPDGRYFVDRHGRPLAIVGGVVAAVALIGGPFGHGGSFFGLVFFFPLLAVSLIAFAVYWVLRARRDRDKLPVDGGTATPWTASPSAFTAPPVPAPAPVVPPVAQAAAGTAPAPSWTPYATAPYATTVYPSGPYLPSATVTTPPTTWKPKERSALGPLAVGAALVTAGVLVGLSRGGSVNIPTVVILASTLAVVGLGLVVGAFVGRARGLIALGIVLTLVTAVAGVVHLPGTSETGDQTWRPVTAAALQPTYKWGAGETMLDLTAISSTSVVATSVDQGVGHLQVQLPRGATLRLHAHVGAGAILVEQPDGSVITTGGISRDVTTTVGPSDGTSAKDRATSTTFDLDLNLGLGQLEVSRA